MHAGGEGDTDTGRGDPFVAAGLGDEPRQLGVGARARRVPGLPAGRLLPGGVAAAADAGAGGGAARPAVPPGAGLRQRRRAGRLHSQGQLTRQRSAEGACNCSDITCIDRSYGDVC
jgi:hypothetical protein